jgi:hypothetical protein
MSSPSPTWDFAASESYGFRFRFPTEAERFDQDEEWFELENEDGWRRLRLHDYAALYETPGLYEALVYDVLGCRSPTKLADQLAEAVAGAGGAMRDLRVIDFGAGNGIVAQRLRERGAREILGVDILPEAAEGAERDYPGVYRDYVVADLGEPAAEDLERIRALDPNCLVTVAALGFGDIPPDAFCMAYNEVAKGGWVGFTIKEDFLTREDESGFARLLRRMQEEGKLELTDRRRIRHRVALCGEPIHYASLVGRKRGDVPPEPIR